MEKSLRTEATTFNYVRNGVPITETVAFPVMSGPRHILIWIASACLGLGIGYVAFAIQAKRWHDRNKSGWWSLIILVPMIGWVWTIVECGLLRGDEGQTASAPTRWSIRLRHSIDASATRFESKPTHPVHHSLTKPNLLSSHPLEFRGPESQRMVPSRTGWRIVTLAVAVYAAASAGDPLNARDFKPVPARRHSGRRAVVRDAQTGGRLVWGAPCRRPTCRAPRRWTRRPPMPPSIQEPLPAAPEPVYAAPEPAAVPEPGPGRLRPDLPVQEAAPAPAREGLGAAGRARRHRRRRGAARGRDFPTAASTPGRLTDPEVEPPPSPRRAACLSGRTPCRAGASLGGDRPLRRWRAAARRAGRRDAGRLSPDRRSEGHVRRELKKLGVRFTDISPSRPGAPAASRIPCA